eukprot:9490172-Pyramimonas_sp.AAC.1
MNREVHVCHAYSHGPNVAGRSAMQRADPSALARAQRKNRCSMTTLRSMIKWRSPNVWLALRRGPRAE